MIEYIKVCEEEGEDVIEIPTENDGTLLLSTLSAQYPGATGLKFKTESAFRGVRLVDGRFHPPEGFWGKGVYYCVFPKENKRKCDDTFSTSSSKSKRLDKNNVCSDLIVLGLPWKMDDNELKEYFESFGEVVMAVVKKDPQSGNSKGFGFIRFDSYEAQFRVLSKRHLIDGRWCDVKIPNSKEGPPNRVPCKIFVGRVTDNITVEDLRGYFSQFGEVTDVYIPKPFRSFAFVTFENPEVAQSLCGEDHILKGVSVHISEASPRGENFSRNEVKKQQQNNALHQKWNSGGGGGGDNTSALLNALGVNPAVVAALNQAGWNLLSNNGAGHGNSGPPSGPSSMSSSQYSSQGYSGSASSYSAPPSSYSMPPSGYGSSSYGGNTSAGVVPPPPPPPNPYASWSQDSWHQHPSHHH